MLTGSKGAVGRGVEPCLDLCQNVCHFYPLCGIKGVDLLFYLKLMLVV